MITWKRRNRVLLAKNETRSGGIYFWFCYNIGIELLNWSFPVLKLGTYPNTWARRLKNFDSQLNWLQKGVCGCWVWYLMGFCCSLSPLLLCERAGKHCPAGVQWLDSHPWRKSVWYSSAGHRSCGWHHFHGQEGRLMTGTDVTESKQSCSFEQWPGSKQKDTHKQESNNLISF